MKKRIAWVLNLLVLSLSLLLVVDISIDTFRNISFVDQTGFLKLQFWVCIFFLLDFFAQLLIAPRKWHFFFGHIFFLLVSIPYLTIFDYYSLHFSHHVTYLLRFIPLIRGGFALVIVVGWFCRNRASSLFFSYLTMLLSTVYFASLMFFVEESAVNAGVRTFGDALWWAFMNVTTVGSNLFAVTAVGKVLTVMLAALGMMTFPVFTVYITDLVQKRRRAGDEGSADRSGW